MGTWSPGPGATAGNDTFTGTETDETADGLGGDDILNGAAGEDDLFGNSGNDTIDPGDDYVWDLIVGGPGTDTLDLSSIQEDGVLAQLGAVYRGVGPGLSDFYDEMEIIRGSQANDRIVGTATPGLSDGVGQMYGLDGDDWMVSFGDATLHGGPGRDLFSAAVNSVNNTVADFEVGVDFVVGAILSISVDGNDTILSFTGYTLRIVGVTGLSLEQWQAHQISSTAFEQNSPNTGNVTGTAGADWIYLGGGNDTANSLGGVDMISGGPGDDTINAGAGEDRVEAGSGNDTVSGGLDNDWLQGDSGDDSLSGGLGADALHGGDGLDAASYTDATAGVLADLGNALANTGDAAGDAYDSIEGLRGSAHADTLRGDGQANLMRGGLGGDSLEGGGGNDTLEGNGGNDTLDGGLGADAMAGAAGDDVYVVDDAGDIVTEFSNQGADTVLASVTHTLGANFETLTLAGAAAINGFGNALNNVVTGNIAANQLNGFDGNDTLDGAGGADSMFGGNGDDVYVVDTAGDLTTEVAALGGMDTVLSSVTRNLTAHIENLTLTGAAAITGAGNSLDNVIIGNSGANTLYGFDGNDRLDGAAGADTLFGANGNDTYVVDNVGDITVEGSGLGGIDIVESSISRNLNANFENLTLTGGAITGAGNALDNVITGNSAANTLFGLDGADTLDGGLGADTLQGGAGADEYVFSSALGGGNVDAIVNFSVVDDVIHLDNDVFTGLAVGALDAGAFHIGAAASDAAHRVIYDSATGALHFDADGAGAGAQVQFAILAAGLALTHDAFFVG